MHGRRQHMIERELDDKIDEVQIWHFSIKHRVYYVGACELAVSTCVGVDTQTADDGTATCAQAFRSDSCYAVTATRATVNVPKIMV